MILNDTKTMTTTMTMTMRIMIAAILTTIQAGSIHLLASMDGRIGKDVWGGENLRS